MYDRQIQCDLELRYFKSKTELKYLVLDCVIYDKSGCIVGIRTGKEENATKDILDLPIK